ncbi:MAG: hypothetical protein AAF242_15855 [Bacteroidota bacterium]
MICKKNNPVYQLVYLLFSIAFLFPSCSDKETTGPASPEIQQFQVIDAGNTHNASDLFFRLSFQAGEVQRIRLVILSTASASDITIEDLENLSANSYAEFPVGSTGIVAGQLPETLQLVDGSNLELNQSYTLRVLGFQGSDFFLSEESVNVNFSNNNPLIGKYVGLWNDAIYTDFSVSIEITSGSETSASGVLYYSPSFTPCCSNPENDGRISFDFNPETQEIENFTYDQRLANYNGGACNATYRGDGEIQGLRLLLNFTGSDCDGDHGNGLIDLSRRWE